MKVVIATLCIFSGIYCFAKPKDKYSCHVAGSHTYDGNTAEVSADGLIVEVNGPAVLFGIAKPSDDMFTNDPESLPWSLSLDKKSDAGQQPLVLSLKAPNQNSAVGTAYGEVGTKYIGLIINSDLEAICKKIE